MFTGLFKKVTNFFTLFTVIVLALYMDKLLVVPSEAFKEIFSVGFPWNLMILTAIIYFSYGVVVGTYKGLCKIFR